MDTTLRKKGDSRIEIRVSNEDKELFEYASSLRGFKNFSEFLRVVLTKESKAIIAKERKILVSKRDKEIFFNALMGKEEEPNDSLISAIKYHNQISQR
jgi:uncharacterized protein (DUF1778 family)